MTRKSCSKCGIEKNLSDFAVARDRKSGRYSQCKICRREAAALRYQDPEIASRRIRDKSRADRTTQLINEKKATGCELCDEKEVVCLDLHHRDPTQKDFQLSNSRNMSEDRIRRELEKCAVLCANHHRKLHAGLVTLGVSSGDDAALAPR